MKTAGNFNSVDQEIEDHKGSDLSGMPAYLSLVLAGSSSAASAVAAEAESLLRSSLEPAARSMADGASRSASSAVVAPVVWRRRLGLAALSFLLVAELGTVALGKLGVCCCAALAVIREGILLVAAGTRDWMLVLEFCCCTADVMMGRGILLATAVGVRPDKGWGGCRNSDAEEEEKGEERAWCSGAPEEAVGLSLTVDVKTPAAAGAEGGAAGGVHSPISDDTTPVAMLSL